MFNMPFGQANPKPEPEKETETPAPLFPFPVAPETEPVVNPDDPEKEHGTAQPAQPVAPGIIRRVFTPVQPDEDDPTDPDRIAITPERRFGN